MTDLVGVINSLLRRRHPDDPPPYRRRAERLDEGTYHLDYGDPDHVYLLMVRQIPRARLSFRRPLVVGEVDGVRVELVQVVVANHVEVALDAEDGAARQATLADYESRFQEWAQRADRQQPPPPSPAETFAAVLRPEVSDDLGTPYRVASGQAGGTGTEWEVAWRFLPVPPVEARVLTLRFSLPGATPIELDLRLPSAEPRLPRPE